MNIFLLPQITQICAEISNMIDRKRSAKICERSAKICGKIFFTPRSIFKLSNCPFYQFLAFPNIDPCCAASASSALPTVFFKRGLKGSLHVQCGGRYEFSNFQIIQFSNDPFYQSLAFPNIDPRCTASASSALQTVFFECRLNGYLHDQCGNCYEFSNLADHDIHCRDSNYQNTHPFP